MNPIFNNLLCESIEMQGESQVEQTGDVSDDVVVW